MRASIGDNSLSVRNRRISLQDRCDEVIGCVRGFSDADAVMTTVEMYRSNYLENAICHRESSGTMNMDY